MIKKSLNEIFIDTIREKIPEKGKLTNKLIEILSIEKEAIYRRLRNDVPFTFAEIVTISRSLSISLDNIVGLMHMNAPYQFQMIDYIYPTKLDYAKLDNYIAVLKYMQKESFSEVAEASCTLPEPIFLNYKHLTRYHLFKWNYHHHFGSKPLISFHDIQIPERLAALQQAHFAEIGHIKHTFYIWDFLIIQYLINDIQSFASLNMITPEDVKILKEELFRMLDYMEELALNGQYKETGNRVFIYISDFNFEFSCSYMESPNHRISVMKAFTLNGISSIDEEAFINMKNWVNSYKRLSNMISVSGEKTRIQFFNRQREIVNTL
ncbi:MAG: hypothetical protein LUG18_08280 [Candidatus Azobacteroides sp.]|nr:hypothetical protein [Candidatus Azobacteroides sp.]